MSDDTVKFQFERAAGVHVVPINGYWLYRTGEGRILCDLFHDRPRPVLAVAQRVLPGDVLGPEVDRTISATVMREILASVEMSPATALAFGQYLVETATQMGAGQPPGAAGTPPVH